MNISADRWQANFFLVQQSSACHLLYTANLIHTDSKAIIKVVRYGLNRACFPDEHAVELCERQVAKQKPTHQYQIEEPEVTFTGE